MNRTGRALRIATGTIVLTLGLLLASDQAARADHVQAIFDEAVDAHQHREYANAVTLYTEAIAADEFPPEMQAAAYTARATIYLRFGEHALAFEDLDEAVRLDPAYADARLYRGIARSLLGDHRDAIADFDRALGLSSELSNYVAQVYYHRGNAYAALGEPARAIEDYDRAIKRNPNYVRAYSARGGAFGELGDKQRALKDLNEALRLNPDFAEAYARRSVTHRGLGDFRRAIADLNEAIRIESETPTHYRDRGLAHLLTAEFGAAARDFSQALAFGDEDPFTILWQHVALARDGASTAPSRLEGDAAALDLNQWPGPIARLFMGDFTPSQLLFAARDAAPAARAHRRSEALYFAGQYYLLHDDRGQAVKLFRRAVDLGVHDSVAYLAAEAELSRLEVD